MLWKFEINAFLMSFGVKPGFCTKCEYAPVNNNLHFKSIWLQKAWHKVLMLNGLPLWCLIALFYFDVCMLSLYRKAEWMFNRMSPLKLSGRKFRMTWRWVNDSVLKLFFKIEVSSSHFCSQNANLQMPDIWQHSYKAVMYDCQVRQCVGEPRFGDQVKAAKRTSHNRRHPF